MWSTLAFASLLVAAVGCDDTATLRITFEGGGGGVIRVFDPQAPTAEHTCTASCEIDIAAAFTRVTIIADPYPETKVVLGGPDLVFDSNGLPQAGPFNGGDELDITARFTYWTEAPLEFARSGEFAPDGDLIVAAGLGLAKVSLAGEPRWAIELTDDPNPVLGVGAIAVASTGESFALHEVSRKLTKLSSTGVTQWTHALGYGLDVEATPTGDVVYTEDQMLVRLRGSDGEPSWSRPVLFAGAIAVAPGGEIYVASRDQSETTREIRRFTPTGDPITPSFRIPADTAMFVGLAIDLDGMLLVASHVLQRIDPATGTVLYEQTLGAPETQQLNMAFRSPGVEVTAANQAFAWMQRIGFGSQGHRQANGTDLRAFSEVGDITWMETFPTTDDRAPGQNVVGAGTCDRSGHCVVFGSVPTTVYDVP